VHNRTRPPDDFRYTMSGYELQRRADLRWRDMRRISEDVGRNRLDGCVGCCARQLTSTQGWENIHFTLTRYYKLHNMKDYDEEKDSRCCKVEELVLVPILETRFQGFGCCISARQTNATPSCYCHRCWGHTGTDACLCEICSPALSPLGCCSSGDRI